MPIKQTVKHLIANTLYWTGILRMLTAIRLKDRAVVLTYHRVLPKGDQERSTSAPGIIVTPETFYRHMEILRRHLNPVSISEFTALLRTGKPFPRGTCLVTFDDGWKDNYEHALDVLREHNIPALIFLATDFIGTDKLFWQEHLGHLFRQAHERGLLPSLLEATPDAGKLAPSPGVPLTNDRLQDLLHVYRRRPYDEVADLITKIERTLSDSDGKEPDTGPDSFMSWQQARAMKASVVSFGAHSCSHRRLTDLSENEIHRELEISRNEIRACLDEIPKTIAYPNGNYDDRVLSITSNLGFEAAFTTDSGFVTPGDNPLALKRVNIHESATPTPALFLSRVLGVL